MKQSVIIAVILASFIAPAVAAAEFYLAQDPSTKHCKIVEAKPDGQTMIMIGAGPYATKDEAKTAKRASAECVKKKKKETN